mmetsp:Transcript_24966/g.53837  ORF Transcript_24966/g.53837 Transcript_24966/m.53837 type:complete len:216 (-) Transcript_24966:1499-2146(-)
MRQNLSRRSNSVEADIFYRQRNVLVLRSQQELHEGFRMQPFQSVRFVVHPFQVRLDRVESFCGPQFSVLSLAIKHPIIVSTPLFFLWFIHHGRNDSNFSSVIHPNWMGVDDIHSKQSNSMKVLVECVIFVILHRLPSTSNRMPLANHIVHATGVFPPTRLRRKQRPEVFKVMLFVNFSHSFNYNVGAIGQQNHITSIGIGSGISVYEDFTGRIGI